MLGASDLGAPLPSPPATTTAPVVLTIDDAHAFRLWGTRAILSTPGASVDLLVRDGAGWRLADQLELPGCTMTVVARRRSSLLLWIDHCSNGVDSGRVVLIRPDAARIATQVETEGRRSLQLLDVTPDGVATFVYDRGARWFGHDSRFDPQIEVRWTVAITDSGLGLQERHREEPSVLAALEAACGPDRPPTDVSPAIAHLVPTCDAMHVRSLREVRRGLWAAEIEAELWCTDLGAPEGWTTSEHTLVIATDRGRPEIIGVEPLDPACRLWGRTPPVRRED